MVPTPLRGDAPGEGEVVALPFTGHPGPAHQVSPRACTLCSIDPTPGNGQASIKYGNSLIPEEDAGSTVYNPKTLERT